MKVKKNSKPTQKEWRVLYEAAEAFKRAACWEWMYEDDLFGLVNPETGEVAYCCIMGNAGEHFAVAGYLGGEGLSWIFDMLSEEPETDDLDPLFMQKCLMCSFEDREALATEDRNVIKDLGLKFRGRNQWPLFQSYEPGKVPWFLNAEQCRFLTHILDQALEVALRCQDGKEILEHENPDMLLTRVWQKSDEGGGEWVDQYQAAVPHDPKYVSFNFQDQVRVQKLKGTKVQKQWILEADTFYFPSPVQDDGRPYFPKLCVFLDHRQGLALTYEMLTDLQEDGYKVIEQLAGLIENNHFKPAKILVAREETYFALYEVCQQLGIKLETVESLPNVVQFREGMMEM